MPISSETGHCGKTKHDRLRADKKETAGEETAADSGDFQEASE